MTLTSEYGIEHCDEPIDGFVKFIYKWKDIPTGIIVSNDIYIRTKKDLYLLLIHWNQIKPDLWEYSSPEFDTIPRRSILLNLKKNYL